MAKFKVGDTAFVFDDWDSPYDGRGGKVVKVDRYVHVKFPDGNVAQFSEDELTKTTNAVRNAVDEAGRPLRQENIQGFKDADGKLIKVGDMLEDTVGTTKGQRSKVVGFKGTQIYLDSGWKISKSNAALTRIVNSRSRNAVVQKALNAVERNDAEGQIAKIVKMIGRKLTDNELKSARILLSAGEPVGRIASSIQAIASNSDTSVLRETAVNGKFKVGDKVVRQGDRPGRVWTIVRADNDHADSWWITDGIIDRTISERFLTIANSTRSANAVVAKALNASHKHLS